MPSTVTKLLSRPGLRAAAGNFGWLAVEKGVRLALGTVVALWLARYLGPERLGIWTYCLAIVALVGFVPALGLDSVLKRDLLEQPDRASELLASGIALRLLAGFVAYTGIFVAARFELGLTGEESGLLRVLGLLLFQPAGMVADLWLQAHLRSKLSVTAQLAALAVGSALRIWMIVNRRPLIDFAWVAVVEAACAAVGLMWIARRTGMHSGFIAATWRRMGLLLSETWPLMFTGLAVLVYMKIDEVMLRQMAGAQAVGTYAAATRLSELWYFVPVGLASSVLPAMLRARSQGPAQYQQRLQRYYDISAATAYALSIPIALCAPMIVRILYGAAYAESGPILAVHIWSSVFVFVGVARGQWLVNEKLQRFYLAATCAGAVANVLLNLVLIPRLGGMGAAIATVASYALAAWVCSYLHPAVRPTARMQTRALLLPLRLGEFLRR